MYTVSQIANATRLAALEHCHSASTIVLDSTARLVDLYSKLGSKALRLESYSHTHAYNAPVNQLVPELFVGHLSIADRLHKDLVRLMEAQIHRSGSIAKFALDKSADMSPPLVEIAIDVTESMITIGETTVDELGSASLQALGKVETKAVRSKRSRKAGT